MVTSPWSDKKVRHWRQRVSLKKSKEPRGRAGIKTKERWRRTEEASKNWKMVAESSAMLTTTLGNMLMALVACCSNNNSIDH
jgi:hypothetical protein